MSRAARGLNRDLSSTKEGEISMLKRTLSLLITHHTSLARMAIWLLVCWGQMVISYSIPSSLKDNGLVVDSDFIPNHFGIVPHIDSSNYWETLLSLVDVDDEQSTYVIKGYDVYGALVNSQNSVSVRSLNGHQSLDLSFSAIFPDLTTNELNRLASATIEGDGDFVFNERFKANGIMSALELKTVKADDWAGAKSQLLNNKEYMGHVEETWKWWTGIANYGSGDFTLSIHNGDSTVNSIDGSFGDLSKIAYVVEDVAGDQKGSWAVFDSDGSVSYQLFGMLQDTTGSNGTMAGLNSVVKLSDEFVIPYSKDGLVDWCGIAILNPGEDMVTGTVKLAYEEPTPFGPIIRYNSVPFSLNPGEKKTGIPGDTGYTLDLESLVDDLSGKAVGDIFINVDSSYDKWSGVGGVVTELVQGDTTWSHIEGITGLDENDAGHYLVLPSVSSNTQQIHNGDDIIYHEGRLNLVNTGDYHTYVTFTQYAPDGTYVRHVGKHLESHQSLDMAVEDVFGIPSISGSITVDATRPIAGAYTLYSIQGFDQGNPQLLQDEKLQSSMVKLQPVNKGYMVLNNFSHDAAITPGVDTVFNITYEISGDNDGREILINWGDGSPFQSQIVGGINGGFNIDHNYSDVGTYNIVIKGYLDDGNMLPDFIEKRSVDVVRGDIQPKMETLLGGGD